MTNFFDLLVLVLAIDALMVIWFDSWLSNLRATKFISTIVAYKEAWEDSEKSFKKFIAFIISFISYPLGCSICLPIHLAVWLFLLSTFLPYGKFIVFIFAAGGLASRLFNNIFE